MTSSRRIAVLGGGAMGEVLARALGELDPAPQVLIVEARAERRTQLEAAGLAVADLAAALSDADTIVLAVKPQDVPDLLEQIKPLLQAGCLVVSIAAGIPSGRIAAALTGAQVVRAMPNTPARVGRGVTGVAAGAGCSAAAMEQAMWLLGSIGDVIVVEESLIDAITAVSGSGPAYLFYLAEAMLEAAVQAGLTPEDARTAVLGTLAGASELLMRSGESPQDLRRQVTSPGGTTAAAIAELDRSEVRNAVIRAIECARVRAGELSG